MLHGSETEILLSYIEAIKVQEVKWNWRYILSRTIRLFRRHIGLNLSPFFENRVGFSFTFLSLSHSFQKVLNSFDESKFILVFTLSQGESFVPHYAVLKSPRFHKKWLAYVHDPYPMACYPESYAFIGPGTEQKKLFMQAVFDRAKFLSFPSLLLSEWMQKFYDIESKKVKIIPHQNSHISFQNSVVEENMFFDHKKFNLLHAGNLLGQRNPVALIEGFLEFMKDNSESVNQSQLSFIGPISPTVLGKFNELKSENVKFFPSQNFDLALNLQKQASVNIIIEAKNEDMSPFLPAKFPHCITANKPVLYLGPSESEVIRLLGPEYKYSVKLDDVNEIKALIVELFNNWKRQKEFSFDNELVHYLGSEYLEEQLDSIIGYE